MKEKSAFSLLHGLFRRSALQKAAAVLFALLVWQIGALLIGEELILPSPISVLLRLFTIWWEAGILTAIGYSLLRIAAGFFIALALGVLLAVVAGRFPFVETLLFPYVAVVKAVPVVSFIVLAYVWMSSRTIAIFISFLIVLPTVYTTLLSGIKARDEKLEEMADVFAVSPKDRFLYLRLPNLAPYITSSVSLGAGLAWKSGVAAEIIAISSRSIGGLLYNASLEMRNVDLFTLTAILVLVSILFEKLLTFLLKLGFRRLWQK
ncbi:MAG: ABC transporter permease subunit [Ruminococcaceae bacterium]|nr:ABC transporter permease subunit [Oscillospiraceae bacterium]